MKKQQITDYFNGDYLAFYRKYLPDLKKKASNMPPDVVSMKIKSQA